MNEVEDSRYFHRPGDTRHSNGDILLEALGIDEVNSHGNKYYYVCEKPYSKERRQRDMMFNPNFKISSQQVMRSPGRKNFISIKKHIDPSMMISNYSTRLTPQSTRKRGIRYPPNTERVAHKLNETRSLPLDVSAGNIARLSKSAPSLFLPEVTEVVQTDLEENRFFQEQLDETEMSDAYPSPIHANAPSGVPSKTSRNDFYCNGRVGVVNTKKFNIRQKIEINPNVIFYKAESKTDGRGKYFKCYRVCGTDEESEAETVDEMDMHNSELKSKVKNPIEVARLIKRKLPSCSGHDKRKVSLQRPMDDTEEEYRTLRKWKRGVEFYQAKRKYLRESESYCSTDSFLQAELQDYQKYKATVRALRREKRIRKARVPYFPKSPEMHTPCTRFNIDKEKDKIKVHKYQPKAKWPVVSYTLNHRAPRPKISEKELWERFEKIFRSFTKTRRFSGDLIVRKTSTEWMTKMGVVEDVLSAKDADREFKIAAGLKITMNVTEYKDFLLSLTMKKKLPFYEICRRMCGV